jgi:hypothetical protein
MPGSPEPARDQDEASFHAATAELDFQAEQHVEPVAVPDQTATTGRVDEQPMSEPIHDT